MRSLAFVGATLALLLVATPVSAHHKPGHGGGPPHGNSNGQGGPPGHRGEAGPESGPGNSGAAHWCKDNYAAEGFKNHGQCVSFFARGGTLDDDDDDDGTGDLEITDVRIDVDDDEGTFFLRGVGAEGTVFALIDGGTGQVVGAGVGEADSNGSWVIEGTWTCRDSDSSEAARLRVFDADERDRVLRSFPCDDLDD